MRWSTVVGVVIAAAAVVGVIVGVVYRDDIRTALALRKCNAAWEKLRDYQSDFQVDAELGPLSPSISGAVTHVRPDLYRLDLGGGKTPECQAFAAGKTVWVYFPDLKTAVQVDFADIDPAEAMDGQSPKPWIDQLGEGSEFRWIGPDTVNGRPCSVLELVPPQETAEQSAAIVSPALGKRFADVPLLGRWQRTRVYLDRRTGLPIRGDALNQDGGILFTWSASNVQVNRGLSRTECEFRPPKGVRVVTAKYDPNHPERLFLPPAKGRSLLRRFGDVLEKSAKEYLQGQLIDPEGERALQGLPR